MRYAGADRSLLSALHAYGRRRPAVAATARTLSYAGEHAALWLAAGLVGAATDRPRRGAWLRATTLTATAHLAGMSLKRLARRPRPATLTGSCACAGVPGGPAHHDRHGPGDATGSGATGSAGCCGCGDGVGGGGHARGLFRPVVGRYSFPSSHAAGAVAAAVAFGALRPGVRRLGLPVAAAMGLSRLVVGVHYPTDVAAGALLGAVTARLGRRWVLRDGADRFCMGAARHPGHRRG
ncbi:hypothetical protein AMK26_08310 [Streptomyces sp. CB03234]|uniref:phosphatase PAP2 family protein n=1 Tax=Streptomyces sp. (strain CB03234) TaxID=1703937 RepID=UPI00093A810F|nr:phosphatase PAP2 family protein [Streptomyces sp. CB03234]OKK06075.1 hypothetical protein AMK26_08310 [Streptomyces sp. CB03234]